MLRRWLVRWLLPELYPAIHRELLRRAWNEGPVWRDITDQVKTVSDK